MIQYYNTEAEYAAAQKSSFESQISLVGADNNIHYDGVNVVVGLKSAKTGDACVLDGNGAMHFIARGTFSSTSFFSNYIYVGPVLVGVDHPDFRGTVVLGYKNNANRIMSYIYSFRLTGYTLDGTDRTGKLKVNKSSSWATYDEYTINYNAESIESMVSQLNAFFQDTTNQVFQDQDWVAQGVDTDGDDIADAIDLVFHLVDYRQCSDSGAAGFSLSANLFPGIKASTAMLRKNGRRAGEGTIFNWDRAIAYFKADISSATYNPTSNVTTTVLSYPICKPAYLGQSSYRMDGSTQLDYCSYLRSVYGEGEEGWLKFMETFLPVMPTAYGVIGDKNQYGDGKKNTYLMANRVFVGQDGLSHAVSPAADYCAAITLPHALLASGCWHMPDAETLAQIFRTIKYNTTNNRNADPINATQYAAGGDAISNGAYAWCASRYYAYYFWCFYGGNGYANYNYVGNGNLVLPVVLLKVNES